MQGFVFGYGLGTSRITLQEYNASIAPIGNLQIGYNISMVNGSIWGTTLNIVNAAQLSAEGISINITNNGRSPPFSGFLEITMNNAKAGKYSIQINATGDDPSISNALLDLLVTNKTGSVSQTTNSSGTTNPGGPVATGEYPGPLTRKTNSSGTTIAYVIVGLLLFIVPILIVMTIKSLGRGGAIIRVSLFIEIIAGAYLIFFDQYLRDLGSLHWYLLIVYTLLNLFFLIEYGKRKKLGVLRMKYLMAIIPAIMALMILIDAAFDMPLSQAAGTNGWAYLFGFGTNPISSLMPSLGTSILLFFSVLVALLSFYEKS